MTLQILVKPLIENFPLDLFGCIVNTPSGRIMHATNHPDIAGTYLSSTCFAKSPLFSHPDNFCNTQQIITGDWRNTHFVDSQAVVKHKHGVDNFLVLCRKHRGSAYLFFYGSTKGHLPLNSIYVNHLSAFNSFSDYFLREWLSYRSKIEPFFADIGDFSENVYFQNPLKREQFKDDLQKKHLLSQIGVLGTPPKKALSVQELACAKQLVSGHSYRVIGEKLNLSPRTVEHYVDSVKNKLLCFSKEELCQLLRRYQAHGIFHLLGERCV